jgi:hypothetical protein
MKEFPVEDGADNWQSQPHRPTTVLFRRQESDLSVFDFEAGGTTKICPWKQNDERESYFTTRAGSDVFAQLLNGNARANFTEASSLLHFAFATIPTPSRYWGP